MDESMITICKEKAKAIVPRDWKCAPSLEMDEKLMHLTIIVCVSADGCRTRHSLILPLKTFPGDLDPFVHYFEWAGTPEGWITEEIFVSWVAKVLIPHINAKRQQLRKLDAKALLWLDGHTSRASPEALKLMVDNNITCVTIPSHSSHVTQPLDNGIFNVFKRQMRKCFVMPDTTETPVVRSALVKSAIQAIYHAVEPFNVIAAFKRTGICPFDPNVILKNPEKVTTSPAKPENTKKKRGFSISGQVITTPEMIKMAADAKAGKATKKKIGPKGQETSL